MIAQAVEWRCTTTKVWLGNIEQVNKILARPVL